MAKRIDVKTNAMRILQQRCIPHEAFTYDESIKTADGAAGAMGVPVSAVFKTLVLLRSEGRPALLMAPGDKEVDMRALAREIKCKDVGLASRTDAESMTGLRTGGIGALALLDKPFDILLDAAANGIVELIDEMLARAPAVRKDHH